MINFAIVCKFLGLADNFRVMITVEHNIDLRRLSTFGVQGTAFRLVTYTSQEDLIELFSDNTDKWLTGKTVHIGDGSNLLFVGDFNGTLLKSAIAGTPIITDNNYESVSVTAGAGMTMDDLCAEMALQSLWGIENLSGIPGQVGAAAVQNIGAYGVEIADVIETVSLFDTKEKEFCNIPKEECGYGYRTSIFKSLPYQGRYIITAVTLRLSKLPQPKLSYGHLAMRVGESPSTTEIRKEVKAMRDSKLPDISKYGNAGSYFKNVEIDLPTFNHIRSIVQGKEVPHYILDNGKIKVPTAWLIEQCGLKGVCSGNAMVWHKQPLVIVNATGSATSADIIRLEEKIVESVKAKFGVTVEPEVEKIQSI